MPLPKNGFSEQSGAQSKITPEKSRDAIELMLTRYGADAARCSRFNASTFSRRPGDSGVS